ncbi:MAG: hypothetical protein ACOYOK_14160 [Pseudobdellovibrionaceae bacterium]
MRLSAIDVGSNAIRMMVVNVEGQKVQIIKKIRAAVRLGEDSFRDGELSPKTLNQAQEAFARFAIVNRKYKVQQCRAVATSAVRESKNKNQFLQKIFDHAKIQIEIIDGLEEARLIHLAVSKEIDLNSNRTLAIDIGGGSVEITFAHRGQITATRSFPLGTVRTLNLLKIRGWQENDLNLVMGEYTQQILPHVQENIKNSPVDFAIGTGGNLECMGQLKVQLLGKTPHTFLTFKEVNLLIDKLKTYSIKDRIEILQLRPDRADVILTACNLIACLMRQAEVEKILIPHVGLRDGLIWSMLKSSPKSARKVLEKRIP